MMPFIVSTSPPIAAAEVALHGVISAAAREIGFLRDRGEPEARTAILVLTDTMERLVAAVSSLQRDAATRAACLEPDDE